MNRFACFAAVLLATAFAMPSAEAAAPAGSIDTTVMDSTFQQLGAKLVQAGRADGLSIAVVKDGRVRFYNFGTVDRDAPRVPTEHTVYEIGSITKVFTSLLLAHAVAEGKVDLQEDIRHYLPGSYPELTFEGTPVRVVNLTNTTSALPDNLPDFAKIVGDQERRLLIAAVHPGADVRRPRLGEAVEPSGKHAETLESGLGPGWHDPDEDLRRDL